MLQRMNIHEGLAKIKLYDKKIQKKVRDLKLLAYKDSKGKIYYGEKDIAKNETVDEFNKRAKAEYTSIIDMINYRRRIKSAIIKSNALTKITIGKEEMTVAEAIELKDSIGLYADLKVFIEDSYDKITRVIEKKNSKAETEGYELAKALNSKVDSEAKDNASAADYVEEYIKARKVELVDDIKVLEKISDIGDYIDTFLSEVDLKLSTSNAITIIEVEDNGIEKDIRLI